MPLVGDFRLMTLAALEELIAHPEPLHFLYGEEVAVEDRMSVDTAWHGIHFLLCGSRFGGDSPLDFIVRGGRSLGHDHGYGPAHAFSPLELKKISVALGPFIPGVLRKRFSVEELLESEIYPHTWDTRHGEWLIDTFAQLKRFLANGARRGLGLVVTTVDAPSSPRH